MLQIARLQKKETRYFRRNFPNTEPSNRALLKVLEKENHASGPTNNKTSQK